MPTPPLVVEPDDIVQDAPNHYQVRRDFLDRWQAQPDDLRGARDSFARLKNGVIDGIELRSVRAYPTLAALGFRAHDVVLRVNGQSVATEDALALYARLRDAARIEVVIERSGATRTFTYDIVAIDGGR